MTMPETTREPVLDAGGDEVELPADLEVTAEFRIYMAGRLPAPTCRHYMPASEVRCGFKTCERCS